jgi:Zn-dependent oligopeptidase
MEKEEYRFNPTIKKYGRDALFDILERLFDDESLSQTQKAKMLKKIDGTIADMESDGIYFSEEVKEKLKREREELFCEYSGLPSPKSYNTNQI